MKTPIGRFDLTLTDLLDVRCEGPTVQDAVNIPLSELADSGGELPLHDVTIRIADAGPEASGAALVLLDMERKATLDSDFAFGPNESSLRLWKPNPFLYSVLPELSPGRAVDLACGAGREAATMCYFGWQVTAIDHLPDALERGERLAGRFGFPRHVRWVAADLGTWTPQPIDLATMFFFLDRDLIRRTMEALRPGGSLLLETFTPTHRERFGKPRHEEYVISPEEASSLVQGLEIVHLSEAWRESGRHTVRLWARSG